MPSTSTNFRTHTDLDSPASQISETIQSSGFGRTRTASVKFSPHTCIADRPNYGASSEFGKEFSNIGVVPAQRNSPKPSSTSTSPDIETQIVDDENFIEWDFSPGNNTVRLPGLHTSIL